MHVPRRATAAGAGAGLATLAALGGELYLANWAPRLLPTFEIGATSAGTVTASEILAGTAVSRIAPLAEAQTVSSGFATGFTGYTVPRTYSSLAAVETAPATARVLTPPLAPQSNQFARWSPLAKAGERPNPAYAPMSPPRAVTMPNLVALPYQNVGWPAAANFFSRAEPRMVNDLASRHRPLSFEYATSIVYNDLKIAAQQTAKEPAAKVSFEVLSGKIKIDASTTMAGVKVSGGELSLYKASMAVGAAVIACNVVADNQFRDCLADAAKKAVKKWLETEKDTKTADGK